MGTGQDNEAKLNIHVWSLFTTMITVRVVYCCLHLFCFWMIHLFQATNSNGNIQNVKMTLNLIFLKWNHKNKVTVAKVETATFTVTLAVSEGHDPEKQILQFVIIIKVVFPDLYRLPLSLCISYHSLDYLHAALLGQEHRDKHSRVGSLGSRAVLRKHSRLACSHHVVEKIRCYRLKLNIGHGKQHLFCSHYCSSAWVSCFSVGFYVGWNIFTSVFENNNIRRLDLIRGNSRTVPGKDGIWYLLWNQYCKIDQIACWVASLCGCRCQSQTSSQNCHIAVFELLWISVYLKFFNLQQSGCYSSTSKSPPIFRHWLEPQLSIVCHLKTRTHIKSTSVLPSLLPDKWAILIFSCLWLFYF